MLNDLIPILLFYFICAGIVKIVKFRNRTKMLKMLIDNNIITSGHNMEDLKVSFNINEDESGNKMQSKTLTIALGLLGFSLGIFLATLLYFVICANISEWPNGLTPNVLRENLCIGLSIFLASVGVCVAYFINSRREK
ncbi:MAG: hypothetical protein SNG38_06540 [Rikenellaceae bacterium]